MSEEKKQNLYQKIDAWVQKKTSKMGSKKEREGFLENFAMLLASGMGMSQTLETMYLDTKHKGMKEAIGDLKKEVKNGSPLWSAIEKIKLLPDHFITLIRIGEESGQLVKNFQAVVLQQKKEREFRSKVRSATMYPVLVMIVTIGIGLAITWLILPRLATVFTQMDLELPFLTRVMIGTGDFLQSYGFIAVPLTLFLLGVCGYLIFIHPKYKHIGQKFLFRSFITKKLIQEMELARFGYIAGTLLNADMPIERVMESLARSTNFFNHKNFYIQLKSDIEKGASFQQGFESYKDVEKLIPISVQQMINSAYSSGHLSDTLIDVGEKYEAKMEQTTKNLPTILEPVLLVVIWLGVVGVAMAVILPIYDLVGGFNVQGEF